MKALKTSRGEGHVSMWEIDRVDLPSDAHENQQRLLVVRIVAEAGIGATLECVLRTPSINRDVVFGRHVLRIQDVLTLVAP